MRARIKVPGLSLGSGIFEVWARWSRDYHNRNRQTCQQRNRFHQHFTISLCASAAPFHRHATNCQIA
jgi:hypothetical protein